VHARACVLDKKNGVDNVIDTDRNVDFDVSLDAISTSTRT
jgi:hypothetical protein